MKRPVKSKTIWFSIIIMVLGIFNAFVVQVVVDPLQQMIILIILGLINIYLRFKTDQALV
jgi:hypothetical protein